MALKALDIFKLLPKTNCKKCGCPTCLAFAMKLAGIFFGATMTLPHRAFYQLAGFRNPYSAGNAVPAHCFSFLPPAYRCRARQPWAR